MPATPVTVPPEETAWLLHRVVGFDAIGQDDTAAILEEATRFAEGVLAPLDAPRRPHRRRNWWATRCSRRRASKEAFRAFAEAGWIGISAPPEHGGQGLPEVLALAASEPVSAANMSFGLGPLLTRDAVLLVATHGTADQQARLLPPMVDGRWTGTMCLTEPAAGSDLSGVRTRADPARAEHWRITGDKIFITYGDHGWTDNILHMVLARLPDAPPGSAGISLFAVPKLLPDGTRNRRPHGRRWSTSSASMRARPACWPSRAHSARWSGRRNRGLRLHVRDDERRPPGRGDAGRGGGRARVPPRRRLCRRAPPGRRT